jgi:hypothetical protein
MRTITVQQRRRRLVRQHCLDGTAASPEAVVDALVALHATDPASVYLAVLARSAASTLAGVSAAMYERRTLVRWLAMRRTLFVFARADIPAVQAAVSTPVAGMLRRQLTSRIERNGTEPPVDGDTGDWLNDLEDRVERALRARRDATGAQLSADVPGLRTLIPPGAPSDYPQHVTSALLTLMSAEGRIVRGVPGGAWTSRQHRWEPVEHWWPGGLPRPGADESRRQLARRWLARFGPATVEDLRWWTGWNQGDVRRALSGVDLAEVDLHGAPGIALAGWEDEPAATAPVATLLPALDPTAMGWKQRDWYLGIDRGQVFDRAGNIGPTLWWDGEIVGSWAVVPGGIRTRLLADRGAAAAAAVDKAAAALHARLDGAVVTPAVRTPLERVLADGEP